MRISERVFVFAGVTMLCVCCPEKFLTTGNGGNKHEEVMNGNSERTGGRVGGNRLDGGNYLEKYNDLTINKQLNRYNRQKISDIISINRVGINDHGGRSIDDYDLIKSDSECIVNAASEEYNGGGGIDKVIHDNFSFDCRKRRDELEIDKDFERYYENIGKAEFGGYVGSAIITECTIKKSAVSKTIKYIIHTIAPDLSMYGESNPIEEAKFCDCFYNCFRLASENKIKSICFSGVGVGNFNWTFEQFYKALLVGYFRWKNENPGYVLDIGVAVYKPNYRNSKASNTKECVELGLDILRKYL